MVATPALDLTVAIVWVGGLTLVLVGRAILSWWRFRRAFAVATQARRLSEATRPAADTAPARHADVIPFKTRAPAAGQKTKS
jgi:hypothetical protein